MDLRGGGRRDRCNKASLGFFVELSLGFRACRVYVFCRVQGLGVAKRASLDVFCWLLGVLRGSSPVLGGLEGFILGTAPTQLNNIHNIDILGP